MTTEVTKENSQESNLSSAEVLVLRDRLARLQRQYEQLVVQQYTQQVSSQSVVTPDEQLASLVRENAKLQNELMTIKAVPKPIPTPQQVISLLAPQRTNSSVDAQKLVTDEVWKRLLKQLYRAYPANIPLRLEAIILANDKKDEPELTQVTQQCFRDLENGREWDSWSQFWILLLTHVSSPVLELLVSKGNLIPRKIWCELASLCRRELPGFVENDLFLDLVFSALKDCPVEGLNVMVALIESEQTVVALIQTVVTKNLFLAVSGLILNETDRKIQTLAIHVVMQAVSFAGPEASATLLALRGANSEPSIGERAFLALFEEVWNYSNGATNQGIGRARDAMNITVKASLGDYEVLVPAFVGLVCHLTKSVSPCPMGHLVSHFANSGDLAFLKEKGPKGLYPPFAVEKYFSN